MNQTFVFATNNINKLQEVGNIISDRLNIKSLKDIGCSEDIPETAPTIEGNALQKAYFIRQRYPFSCFADDTGLEVDALNGEPGVYSARYAGDACDSQANIQKLLTRLSDQSNRHARFRTVIALVMNDQEFLFEGMINGEIALQPKGNSGFGYDSVFIPNGYEQTFAEMGDELKNTISHRAIAVQKLVRFLQSLENENKTS